jgi:hypothetical protein
MNFLLLEETNKNCKLNLFFSLTNEWFPLYFLKGLGKFSPRETHQP